MSLLPGLCSVTLRALGVEAIARLAGECGLRGIEWGADVHVPPGDAVAVRAAVAASRAAEVDVVSYGSYLFAGQVEDADAWRPVLDAAVALGAPNVRVWAPFTGDLAPGGYADALGACAQDAAAAGLTLSLEFHGGTATATVEGVLGLLDQVDAPNLFTYWQPPYWRAPTSGASDAAEVVALRARLSHLHVYEWAAAEDRRPLTEGGGRWPAVLDALGPSVFPSSRYALLEFVRDDRVEQLRADAATLQRWLAAG